MTKGHKGGAGLTRRDFMRAGLAGAASAAVGPLFLHSEVLAEEGKADIWALHGKDKRKLMESCMKVVSENGGFGTNVNKLALKVNAAWNRTPEQAANTNPELVAAFLKGCKGLGIKDIVLPEHPCNNAKYAFKNSGILDAAETNGARMVDMKSNKNLFKDVALPHGKNLKQARVSSDLLDADVVVNMPVAKHHGGAILTMAMKNWMGAVEDRGFFHRNNLHQCIADFSTFMKPAWTIIDATRIMMDKGPKGPTTNMKDTNLLIVSKDQVAADAYTSLLFHDSPYKVKHLEIARDMGIGVTDVEKMTVHKIEVG